MFSTKELEFLNGIAFSNFSSNVVVITDFDIKTIFPLIVLFNRVTQNDIYMNVHLYGYKHIEYLNFLKTLFSNAPIDMNTHVIRGEDNFVLDMHLYEDITNDIIFIACTNLQKVLEALSVCWKKLKSNGCLLIKGIPHDQKTEIQKSFVSFISDIPSTIKINICLIEGTDNFYFIKKPCYDAI
jgi:hypothetical protein